MGILYTYNRSLLDGKTRERLVDGELVWKKKRERERKPLYFA